jgi:hypothetical protein
MRWALDVSRDGAPIEAELSDGPVPADAGEPPRAVITIVAVATTAVIRENLMLPTSNRNA